MSTAIYILASHNFRLLTTQIAILREKVADLAEIIIVDGPFGAHVGLSAGYLRLTDAEIAQLGVSRLTLPTSIGGLSHRNRVSAAIGAATTYALGREARFIAVIHADLLPLEPVVAENLLQGHAIATCGRESTGKMHIYPMWFAIDTEDPDVQREKLEVYELTESEKCKIYSIKPVNTFEDDLPTALSDVEVPVPFAFQWCQPWLHLSHNVVTPADVVEQKVKVAERILKRELPLIELGEVIQDAPIFIPRVAGVRGLYSIKNPPKIAVRVEKWLEAVHFWLRMGRPERSDAEIARIFDQICSKCSYFRENNTCGACGCRLSGNEKGLAAFLSKFGASALVNKLRMGTEHCPQWHW